MFRPAKNWLRNQLQTHASLFPLPAASRFITSTTPIPSIGTQFGPIASKNDRIELTERSDVGPVISAAFVVENNRSAPFQNASRKRSRLLASPLAISMIAKLSRYTPTLRAMARMVTWVAVVPTVSSITEVRSKRMGRLAPAIHAGLYGLSDIRHEILLISCLLPSLLRAAARRAAVAALVALRLVPSALAQGRQAMHNQKSFHSSSTYSTRQNAP